MNIAPLNFLYAGVSLVSANLVTGTIMALKVQITIPGACRTDSTFYGPRVIPSTISD
jgi:hypothetical protein